jgi:hypothetical protein
MDMPDLSTKTGTPFVNAMASVVNEANWD